MSVVWLTDIGRALQEAFFMFWETLWPLVLGFALSGAIQAFVSRESLRRSLGSHGPSSTARASLFGMASSSCSYAASAMAKSLFTKGADFVATTVFMFASTNLVVELGIVLIVLMGWQFAASELVGGIIMIVLLASLGGLYLRGKVVVEARRHLTNADPRRPEPAEDVVLQQEPWGRRLRSKSGWADAATYMMADLSMVRRELALGYVIAGVLATQVPVHAWNVVFLSGHGWWTSIENVIVGPFIAMVSFVCSVGNVPLAAALWQGGISFGGVVAFIFADLIALPLLLIYRRYYGTRLMLRMLAVFWVIMSIAGLLTELLFGAAGIVPTTRPSNLVAPAHFSWNYTTYLNIIFIALFGLLWWASRHPREVGGGTARDPVCGMTVTVTAAPASVVDDDGHPQYFCSDQCLDAFHSGRGRGQANLTGRRTEK